MPQHKDRVGQVDEPCPKGVTSCLGNVTATREGELKRGGVKFLPAHSGRMEVGFKRISVVVVGLGDCTAVLCALHALPGCSNQSQKKRRNWVTTLNAQGSVSETHLLSQPSLPNIVHIHPPSPPPNLH